MAQKGALSQAYSSMRVGKYDEAIRKLSDAEQYRLPDPQTQAEIAFMRAKCYEGLQRKADALGAYDYIVATFPRSQYAFQAKERLIELRK